jgi:Zn-dependent membrane protease YugP
MIFLGFLAIREPDLTSRVGLWRDGLLTLITLPVEIDEPPGVGVAARIKSGSRREMPTGARQVLTAAALTYVAAAVTAVLTLLYYLSLANRRR